MEKEEMLPRFSQQFRKQKKNHILNSVARAQLMKASTAPFNFSTPLCKVRYQKEAGFVERCCFFCGFSASFYENRGNIRFFSVLHVDFTAFAYKIRAPPSEI
jgi:hypothetical protein